MSHVCSRPIRIASKRSCSTRASHATDDCAHLLRRGRKLSRRENGADHEETLAHLAALAVHLEATGRRKEAAEFKRKHDRIRERKKSEG
jgi:hypothetical protein